MAPHRPDDDPADDLPPTEAARARRRDHDADAAARAGMRTGLAKQFKQVLDAQAKRARAAGPRGAAGNDVPDDDGETPIDRRDRHHDHRRHTAPPGRAADDT